MASPFDYVDLLESRIKSLEAQNNKHDPTGKLNELRIPPLRRRQQQYRPTFYDPSQHSSSPQLSVKLEAPPTIALDAPYRVTVTLRHHPNPTGNPHNRPVTLAWKDTALHEILDTEIYPWLLLHHVNGKLEEIDDGNNGPGMAAADDESKEQIELSEENGFISLAVDESRIVEVKFKYTSDGLQLQPGEEYSIVFRGSRVHWWKWASLDEFKGQRKVESESDGAPVTIPASNLVAMSVASPS